MKRFLSILLAGTLLVSLSACGSSTSYPNQSVMTAPAEADGYDAYDLYEAAPTSPDFYYMDNEYGEDESWRYVELDPQEEYDNSDESPFKRVLTSPLSTFSSDVDTASYSNMRRFINNGQKPQGVRIEELVNYFEYTYPQPAADSEHPFTITTEISACPWDETHQLAMIGVQGKTLEDSSDIANNIVFLIDVSGSMDEPNKLPLLKESFIMLIDNLGANDVISIVTYAGSDKIVADSVAGNQHDKLKKLINNLSAGGSTAGADGIRSAYRLAEKNFIQGGNNRVILATDGDFNVGESSIEALTNLIETQREKGIFISVLGYGMYNLKDNMMETIADHGNGNYAYIDTIQEAKKVLVDEFDSTMFTIAKDLKFQVEFNPAVVQEYRLIGYNNRRLEDEDFNDDKKDAGDIGAGHSVTAFYELVLTDGESVASVDDLTYQQAMVTGSEDYMTVKVRYKDPDGDTSKLVQQMVSPQFYTNTPTENFAFASAVAEFGLILTDSDYSGGSSVRNVLDRAGKSLGRDSYGLRGEFVSLVMDYQSIAR